MEIISTARYRAGFRLRCFPFLFWALWFATAACVYAEKCAVCGEEITSETIYVFTDEVTHEKKHVCYDCSIIPDVCFVCGMPVKKEAVKLQDGRVLCSRDVKDAVMDADEAKRMFREVADQLDRLLSRFTSFPTNVNLAVVDRVNLEALFKVPGNDVDCPDILGYFQMKTNHQRVRYDINLMSALPRAQLKSTCAHELSHAWIAENVSVKRRESLDADAKEGFCELVAYLLMDSQNESEEMKSILQNNYTRGQIELFIAAERAHGFNDVLDWMRWGTDGKLDEDSPNRVREVEIPRAKTAVVTSVPVYLNQPISAPETLMLKGISGGKGHELAMINDQSLAVGESAKVHVGGTNILVKCLEIRDGSVRIRVVGSGEERELFFRKSAAER